MRIWRGGIRWPKAWTIRLVRHQRDDSALDAGDEFDEWLNHNCEDELERIDCQLAIELVQELTDDPDVRPLMADCRQLVQQSRAKGPTAPKRHSHWVEARIPLLAASVVLAVCIAIIASIRPDGPRYETGVGEQRTVIAEDGTVITLNTDSELVVSIDQNARQILLERGQAFFSVTPDALRPFEVIARDGIVRAVGTAFEVAMHSQPGQVRVAVLEGSVEIRPRDTDRTLEADHAAAPTVSSGELATYWGSGRVATVTAASVKSVTAWRDGKLDFHDQRLAEALAEYNRYTNTKIVLGDAELADLRISGVVRIRDADGFLFLLEESLGLTVVRQNGVIMLRNGRHIPEGA